MKRVLIVIDKAPNIRHHCGTIVGEGLRAAVGLAGMDIDTTVVLVDDAVVAALKGQNAEGKDRLDQVIEDAKEYGVKAYVHLESAEKKGVRKDQLTRVQTIDTEQLAGLVHEADVTITF